MEDLQQIELMMEELGPAVEIVDAVEQLDAGVWGVVCLDDRVAVVVECEEGGDRLFLETEHDRPSEENRLPTCEALLKYNALAQQTGGIRMGLNAEGMVTQECDLPVQGLDLRGLQAALENFVAKAIVWQSILGGGGVRDADATPDDATQPSAIRV